MSIFSFRAECYTDVLDCLAKLKGVDPTAEIVSFNEMTFHGAWIPDCEVEMQSAISLAKIRALFSEVPDTHVICETLRECPLVLNSLERV